MFEHLLELSNDESFVSTCIAVFITLMTLSHLSSVAEFGFLDVVRIVSNVVVIFGCYKCNVE